MISLFMVTNMLEVMADREGRIDLVETNEYMSLMLECLSTQEYKDAVARLSPEAREAAMWGMAFCSIYANVHATHYGAYLIKEEESPKMEDDTILTYPCNNCGSCPIWLAAYDIPELDTHEKVVQACHDKNCSLVGTYVLKGE